MSAESVEDRHVGPQEPQTRDAPGVIAPPPLIYLTGLGIGFALEALLPSASVPRALAWPVGAILLVIGLALARSFVAAFRRADTAVNPGKPTTTLVTAGPYRVTRNPGYLGMALTYAGISILFGDLWPFVLLVPAVILIDRGVIAREERYLEAKFGEAYARYKREVRRWL